MDCIVQPKNFKGIIFCKQCELRGQDECPMRHTEMIFNQDNDEWDEDVYDHTTDYGFCDRAIKVVE